MGNPNRILVVEDEKDWQDKYKSILEREGFEVEITGGYGEALAGLRRKSFDLAIIDIHLRRGKRDFSGMALVEYTCDREIPTIVVTGYGTRELADTAIKECGAFSFIDKPSFDRMKLIELVKEAIAFRPKPAPEEELPSQRSETGELLQASLQLKKKKEAVSQVLGDFYKKTPLVIKAREEEHLKWLKQTYRKISQEETEDSKTRTKRDIERLDEIYQRIEERVKQAGSLEELTALELEIIEEGEEERWMRLS